MNVNKCPYCQSDKIEEGVLRAGNSPLYLTSSEIKITRQKLNSHLDKVSPIKTYYCGDCGYILGAFAEEPNKLD